MSFDKIKDSGLWISALYECFFLVIINIMSIKATVSRNYGPLSSVHAVVKELEQVPGKDNAGDGAELECKQQIEMSKT